MDETKLENEQETSVSSDTRYTANPIRVTRRNFLRSSAVGSAVAIGGPLACTPAPTPDADPPPGAAAATDDFSLEEMIQRG